MDSWYNQIIICQIYLLRVREVQVEWRKVRYRVCLTDRDQLEVRRSKENFVDAWYFFLFKWGHVLMMLRE